MIMIKFNMVAELSMRRPSNRHITVVFLDLGTFCELRYLTCVAEMTTNPFRPKEKIEGSSNYNSWKARLIAILEENDLDDLVFKTI